MQSKELRAALLDVMNIHGVDSFCNIPDYIIAEHLYAVILGLSYTYRRIEEHAGRV